MRKQQRVLTAIAVQIVLVAAAHAQEFPVLDQIGAGSFTATAMSSSQFPPTSPESAFITIDNFSIESNTIAGGLPVRLTTFEAVVGGLQNFNGFDLIDAWTVQIYSSLEASTTQLEGDVYSASFDAPANLTSGYSSWFGDPIELATFDIDVILNPGEYWITLAMANDGAINGTVGVAGSLFGDGPALFSGPGPGDWFALSNPAAYRLFGIEVPAPGGGLIMIGAALSVGRRRRHCAAG